MEYSINKGLWGTSIGGKETLQSNQTLPESAYPSQVSTTDNQTLKLEFKEGELHAVNGEVFSDKVKAINKVEEIGNKYGIGRDMHRRYNHWYQRSSRIRSCCSILIINAHKMLEKHTLSKWQQYWKDQVGTWYGMFLHEAQYLSLLCRDIEAMLESSQRNVNGTVSIILRPYSYTLVGVESTYDLVKTDFGEYGEVQKDGQQRMLKVLPKYFQLHYAYIIPTKKNSKRN